MEFDTDFSGNTDDLVIDTDSLGEQVSFSTSFC